MELNPLIPIGTTIKVDKTKIENLIPERLLDDLPKIIVGKVIDYKMTDGMGIGYVLMTENDLKLWIFSTELTEQTKREYEIEPINNSINTKDNDLILGIFKLSYEINGNRKIKTIANPINLISWLIFTLKDIF